jgi:hypothetical protein
MTLPGLTARYFAIVKLRGELPHADIADRRRVPAEDVIGAAEADHAAKVTPHICALASIPHTRA